FQSLAHDDQQQLKPILYELQQITGASCSNEIAIISETASGYRGPTITPTPAPTQTSTPASTPTETPISLACLPDVPRPLLLHSPRDIGPLRNAYQAMQDSLAATKANGSTKLPLVSLPRSYGDIGTQQQDTVPALSQSQTPVSQDVIMQQIAQS